MTARSRWIILGFALAGLAFATASAWVHYRLRIDPTYISGCDINATFNCSDLYLSQYGAVRGVPVALGGVFWFALVALVAGFSRPASTRNEGATDPAGGYLFVLATIGLASILYLGYASLFLLKTACVYCIGTYASVIGIFVVSGLASSLPMTQLPMRLWHDVRSWAARPLILIVALLFIAGSTSLVAFFPKEGAPPSPQQPVAQDMQAVFADAWEKQPRVDLGVPADGAKVVVVKFNDWLCGSCKAMHVAYEPIFAKYEKSHPGAVKYVVKDWPWSTKCNFNIQQSIVGHEGSCDAAAAVRMATDRGKGDAMSDWLFANQDLLNGNARGNPKAPEQIKAQVATMLGVKDYDREYTLKLPDIRKDVTLGGSVNITGTPTYFVNGVRCISDGRSLPAEYFDFAIQIELKKPIK